MPGHDQLSGFNLPGLLALVIILGVVFSPVLLCRRGSDPDQSDGESDDGWGGGPPRRPDPPDMPPGGIPLDDAHPARVRLRGHDRLPDRLPARVRRPAKEPAAPNRQPIGLENLGDQRRGPSSSVARHTSAMPTDAPARARGRSSA